MAHATESDAARVARQGADRARRRRKLASAPPRIEGGIMRGDIVLSGFVLTAEEWAAMDRAARVQLLRAARRKDEWLAEVAPPLPADDLDDELTAA